MNINRFDGDPYSEVQYIIEVLERGNPLKGVTSDGGIIKIEQSKDEDVQKVIEELEYRGYTIVSKIRQGNFTVVGISKEKTKANENTGFELVD